MTAFAIGMTAAQAEVSVGSGHSFAFQNTLWSRVIAAGRLDSPNSQRALEELCRLYWSPIYAFLRRWGHDRQQARDLTQGFFAYLLKKNLFEKANPERGRFRSFLLGTLNNFVSSERRKQEAIHSGGGVTFVSIDEEVAEGRYAYESATSLTPDKLFDRRWALLILEQAMHRLEAEYARAKMQDLLAALQPYLTGEDVDSFAELGVRLNRTEGTARVLVFRFRSRFRQLIRAVIADTVSDLELVEIELKHLQAALRES